MNSFRAIIMAGGPGTRWKGEEPKHFVPVAGESILHRTVRLLRERGVEDVWIMGRTPAYDHPDAQRFEQAAGTDQEIDKFLASRSLWTGDTRMLYGDVFYTEHAMDRITAAPAGLRIFGRRFKSRITGTKHGEIFGVTFTNREQTEAACQQLRAHRVAGLLPRAGSWELYQVLIGRPPRPFQPQHFDHHWNEVDDWTEDFDSLEEWEEWKRRRLAAGLPI